MLEDGLITLESKKGLIGNKEVVKIDEDKFANIIKEIKTEFLEKRNLTEDLILLASLLNSTKFLKNIFNKYEKEELNNRLKEIKDTEIANIDFSTFLEKFYKNTPTNDASVRNYKTNK